MGNYTCTSSGELQAQNKRIEQLTQKIQRLEKEFNDFRISAYCPLTTFHGFLKLPAEIRNKIWKMRIPGRRIIRAEKRQLSYPPPVFADYLTNFTGNNGLLNGIHGAGAVAAAAALAGAGSSMPMLPWRMVNTNGTSHNYVSYPNEYSPVLEVFDYPDQNHGLLDYEQQREMEMAPNAAGPMLRNPYNDPPTVTFMLGGGPKADNRWVMRRRQKIYLGRPPDHEMETTILKGSKVPPLLHACQESREVAMEAYDFCFSIKPVDPAVIFRAWSNFPDLDATMNEIIPHSQMASPGIRFQPACDMIFLDYDSFVFKVSSMLRTDNIQYLGISWHFKRQYLFDIWSSLFLAADKTTNLFPNLKTLDLVVSEYDPSVKDDLEVLPERAKRVNAEFITHWIQYYPAQGDRPSSPPAPVIRIVTRKDFFAELDRCNRLAQY